MTVAEQSTTSFDLIGGAMIVRQITDHFYDLMEADPAYAKLRDLPAEDLPSTHVSLACSLTAWLGGRLDCSCEHRGACLMYVPARSPITRDTAGRWVEERICEILDYKGEPTADRT